MSEQQPQQPQSTEAFSLEDQKAYADQRGDGRPRVNPSDPVTILEAHARKVIDEANLPQQNKMMALPKLSEMIFWIRSGAGRG